MTTRNELPAAGAFLLERFPRGGRVLCAVSGGLDSMCLLHYLDTWGRAHGLTPARHVCVPAPSVRAHC